MSIVKLSIALLAIAAVATVASDLKPAAVSDIKTIVSSYFSLQSQSRCNDFVNLFATNFTLVDPYGAPPVTSKSDLLAGCQGSGEAFSAFNAMATSISVDGMFASAHFVINGTMKPQPAPGPAWPCQISFGGFDIFNFVTEDNRLAISSVVGFYDPNIPGSQANCTQPKF